MLVKYSLYWFSCYVCYTLRCCSRYSIVTLVVETCWGMRDVEISGDASRIASGPKNAQRKEVMYLKVYTKCGTLLLTSSVPQLI